MGWKFFNSSGQERAARPASVVNPECSLGANVVQSMIQNTWTALTWNVVRFDTDGMAPSSGGTRITIQHAGKYQINALVSFANASIASLALYKNGTLIHVVPVSQPSGAQWTRGNLSVLLDLIAGDYLEVYASNSAASTPYNTQLEGNQPYFSAVKVDDALVSYVEVPKSLVGQELAYAERTTGVGITASDEANPTNILSAPSVTFDGVTPVLIEFWSPSIGVAAGVGLLLNLWEDTTNLGRLGEWGSEVSSGPRSLSRHLTPAAGAKVYKVAGFRGNPGTPSVGAGAGGSGNLLPMFLRITRAA